MRMKSLWEVYVKRTKKQNIMFSFEPLMTLSVLPLHSCLLIIIGVRVRAHIASQF